MSRISRRRVLLAAAASPLAAGCSHVDLATKDPSRPQQISAFGTHQAGIAVPSPAQPYCAVTVWNLPVGTGGPGVLGRLGIAIAGLPSHPALAGMPVADLTATVGVGPRLTSLVRDLPRFPGDQVDDRHRGGDLLLQICAADPVVVTVAQELLGHQIAGQLRWAQDGFRGTAAVAGVSRNVLGFADGIVVPHTADEFAKDVWLDDGGTIAVVRRMRLDLARFQALPVADQERVFGRRKTTAEPLSGGAADADPDLGAKAPDGQYLIPVRAHVRKANPLALGVGTMLRRSYNYDAGPGDRGLLFISFQRELRTFVNTAYGMSDGDALLDFATTTASASFYVLPGFTPAAPLGSRLS